MNDEDVTQKLSFWEHINDLRVHLLWGGGFFIVIAIGFFSSSNWILRYILIPLNGEKLVFLSPLGPIFFQMNIAFLGAFIVSLPIWLLLLAHFVGTALPQHRRLPFYLLVLTSLILGILSIVMTYKLVVPLSLAALSKFIIPGTAMMLTADSYLNFFMLGVGVTFIIFELPVVIVALAYLRLVNPYYIARKRRYYILGLIITLAIITPTTDVVTLIVVTVPAIILCEIGILVAKAVYKGKSKVEITN